MNCAYDRKTVEGLMAEVRAFPENFSDAKAVVRRSGFGATRLSEILRTHYHTTPAELLLQARVERAKERLLRGRGSLLAIAGEAGFESISVFHQNFRRCTGLTPGAFRRAGAVRNSAVAYTATFAIPLGSFSVAVEADGALCAAAFGAEGELQELVPGRPLIVDLRRTSPAQRQVEAYFQGKRRQFSLPLRPSGSRFQRRVWAELTVIPSGRTRNYGEIARRIGSSPRAVGRAIATNPLCLFIPCHRVIGADGSLTGYAFGIGIKRRLLEHERRFAARRQKPEFSRGP